VNRNTFHSIIVNQGKEIEGGNAYEAGIWQYSDGIFLRNKMHPKFRFAQISVSATIFVSAKFSISQKFRFCENFRNFEAFVFVKVFAKSLVKISFLPKHYRFFSFREKFPINFRAWETFPHHFRFHKSFSINFRFRENFPSI
jgi:hypothetical protein